jgi:hypothetical protein
MDRRVRAVGLLGMALALSVGAGSAAGQAEPPDPGITSGAAQRDLDAARGRWSREGARDYSYDLSVECFCPPEARAPVRIAVRDGRPAAVPERVRHVATVPLLFAVVQEAIDARVAALRVEYGERGVPRSIWIDRSARMADEEVGYRIEGFKTGSASGDATLRLRWEGPRGTATRLVVCDGGVLRRGWPDREVCGRLLADERLRRPITVETKDLRRTDDPLLFRASGRIEGTRVDFTWRGSGSGTRLHRLREWEAALGSAAIERVRGG